MRIMDWIIRLLMVEPLESATPASIDDGALTDIRQHIDTLRSDSTAMERRLVTLERKQQQSQGWLVDEAPKGQSRP